MHCQSCGADVPADARFCIECGATTANTGATVQLPRSAAAAIACRSCGSANPDYAAFCVRCGQPLAEPAPVAAGLGGPQSLTRSAPPSARGPRRAHRRQRHGHEALPGVLFLFGLAAFFLLKLPFWPGILILVGLVAFTGEAMRGRYYKALSSVIWLFGITFLLIVPRLWWPGMLVLVGLNVLLDVARRSLRRP
jgi:Double zinc ribbon